MKLHQKTRETRETVLTCNPEMPVAEIREAEARLPQHVTQRHDDTGWHAIKVPSQTQQKHAPPPKKASLRGGERVTPPWRAKR